MIIRDDAGHVVLIPVAVERILAPETPPPLFPGLLHLLAHTPVREDFIAVDHDIAHLHLRPSVYDEGQRHVAVFSRLLPDLDIGQEIAFFFEISPNNLPGPLDVAGAEACAGKQRDGAFEILLMILFDALEAVAAQAWFFLHCDDQVDPVALAALLGDLHIGEVAELVERADGIGQSRIARNHDALPHREAAALPDEIAEAFLGGTFDAEAQHFEHPGRLCRRRRGRLGEGRLGQKHDGQRTDQAQSVAHHSEDGYL